MKALMPIMYWKKFGRTWTFSLFVDRTRFIGYLLIEPSFNDSEKIEGRGRTFWLWFKLRSSTESTMEVTSDWHIERRNLVASRPMRKNEKSFWQEISGSWSHLMLF
jgi:hypothetical protein